MRPNNKYEEALERARKGMPIDEVFPELKESEDERIRKNCIHFLKLQKAHHADTFEIDDCIAYLERQKEQKPIPVPKFKVGDRIYDKRDSYNRNTIREVGRDYYINAFAQKMDMAYTDANFEFLEHLDIKPTKWSKFNLQPKQEWSEEDLQHKNWILEFLADGESKLPSYAADFRAAYNWLNSLCPQPHWKPSEEQMESLSTAYRLGKLGKTDMEVLQSLYEELKRL